MTRKSQPDGLSVRVLTPEDWPNIMELFGAKGACGGCWCMYWRIERGGKTWEAAKGEPNRRAFKRLVETGQARGILAFHDKTPVGWCSFGRRADFPRLDRKKAYVRADIDSVWSINCLFILPSCRGRRLGHQMVEAAVAAIRRLGGRLIEAYPVTLTQHGQQLPPAFSFTGPEVLYQRLGFTEVQRLSPSSPLYRRRIK